MKVLVEVTHFAAIASNRDLRNKVAELEDLGATGVSVSDHLFVRSGTRPCDPLTTLAAVAALTDRLELQTMVMNSEWIHPALLLPPVCPTGSLGRRAGDGWPGCRLEWRGVRRHGNDKGALSPAHGAT
jgi:Luciferase-like monooxygenase